MTSFIKYQEDEELRKGNGRGPLSFSRAELDGMPWRGHAPLMREEEYQELSSQVNDFDVGLFDIRNPEERKRLKEVFDRVTNGWYQILDYDKNWVTNEDGTRTVVVYVMWAVPHKELDQNKARRLGGTEVPSIFG